MTDDATLERDLRTMLAARDPGPSRDELAGRVGTAIATDRAPTVLGRIAGPVATAALLAAALGLAIVLVRPVVTGPGAAPPPGPAAAPYVIAPGDGVVDPETPIAQFLVGIVACAGLFLRALEATERRTRSGCVVALLAIVVVGMSIGQSNALTFEGGGYGVNPAGAARGEEMLVAVTGDQPYTVLVTVTNGSRLPLTILGIPALGVSTVGTSRDNVEVEATMPRMVGIGSLPGNALTVDAISRFQPTTVAPGGHADLAFLGLAGTCARPSLEASGGAFSETPQIALVYEQLTIVHVEWFDLPRPITIPFASPCP